MHFIMSNERKEKAMRKNKGTAATPAIIFVVILFIILFWVVTSRGEEQISSNEMNNQNTASRNLNDVLQEYIGN